MRLALSPRPARAVWLSLGVVAACAATASSPAPQPPAPAPASASAAEAASAASAAFSAFVSSSASASSGAAVPGGDPLPEGFVRVAEEGQTRCGGLLVEMPPEKERPAQRFVRVLRGDGQKAYEAHGRRYRLSGAAKDEIMYLGVEFCGDLTGDGVPELVLLESTIGAHCCHTYHVVSLTSPSKRLMTWEKGDFTTTLEPVRLRDKGPWQIQGATQLYPRFDREDDDPTLSYGPAHVPVVFSLQAGEYQLTTLSFPGAIRRRREEAEAFCKRQPDDCGVMSMWMQSLAIGDWSAERMKPYYRDILAPLDRNAEANRKLLLKALGSESSPARLTPLR